MDNYTTAVEKTPQERDLEGNLEKETADDETDSRKNTKFLGLLLHICKKPNNYT